MKDGGRMPLDHINNLRRTIGIGTQIPHTSTREPTSDLHNGIITVVPCHIITQFWALTGIAYRSS